MSSQEKEKRSYELQINLLQSMQEEAVRTDRSLSYLVQEVWQNVYDRIAGLHRIEDLEAETPGDKTTQSVFVPARMHDQIESKSRELGCSPSRLIETAWKLSRK